MHPLVNNCNPPGVAATAPSRIVMVSDQGRVFEQPVEPHKAWELLLDIIGGYSCFVIRDADAVLVFCHRGALENIGPWWRA